MDGRPVSAQEAARLSTSREQFGACWRVLQRHLKTGKEVLDLLPCIRQLAAESGGSESFLRSALSIAVFRERGLISASWQGQQLRICLTPPQGKVDLFSCPYLTRLESRNQH